MVDPYRFPYSAITGAMRKQFARSPIVKAVRDKAKIDEYGPRGGQFQQCSNCKKGFSPTKLQCDHIDEVVPIGKTAREMSLDEYALRLYCKETFDGPTDFDNLQMLCKVCHDAKTKIENVARKQHRQGKKKRAKDAVSKMQ